MGQIPYTGTGVGGSGGGSPVAEDGQILLTRNGKVLANYGDTRITETDYGDGFKDALANAQAGDKIIMQGVVCRLIQAQLLNKSGVTILAKDAFIKPSGTYQYLFQIQGSDDVTVDGLVIDGEGTANPTTSGTALTCNTSDRLTLRNIECHRTRDSTGGLNAAGISFNGCDDLTVSGYKSFEVGWSAIRLDASNRVKLDDIFILSPGNRAINIAGSTDIDWIEITNYRAIAVQPTSSGWGVGHNVNVGTLGLPQRIKRLILRNFHAENLDLPTDPGFSYNDTAPLQMMKCHNIDRLEMDNVSFKHGGNVSNPTAPSFQVGGDTEGQRIKEILMHRVHTDGPILFAANNKADFIHLRECNIAARGLYGRWNSGSSHPSDMPIRRLLSAHTIIEDTELNCHNGSSFISIMGTSATGDRMSLRNNRYKANRTRTSISPVPPITPATDPEDGGPHYGVVSILTRHGGRDDDFVGANEGVKAFAGNIVHVGGTFQNAGTDPFANGQDEVEELLMTTDANGDLLFDPDKFGTGPGKHPAPFPGYVNPTTTYTGSDFFQGVFAPNATGRTIKNVKYSSSAPVNTINTMKAWIAGAHTETTATFTLDTGHVLVTTTGPTFANGHVVIFKVSVRNTALAVTFTEDGLGDLVATAPGHTFVNGNVVAFDQGVGGLLPGEVGIGRPIWVRDVSGSTFKLANSLGGAAIEPHAFTGTAPMTVRRRELPSTILEDRQYWVTAVAGNSFKLLPALPTMLPTPTPIAGVSTELGTGGTKTATKTVWRKVV